jgi:hypothetical protein
MNFLKGNKNTTGYGVGAAADPAPYYSSLQ